MLRTRIRPEIDPDEYLRSHPVLTDSDLAAASQVGQLPGTSPDEQEMTFTLDEVDPLPGVASPATTAPAPLGIGWDDVRGGLNRAASGLTSGLRSVGDLARRAPPINPWQGEPAPDEMSFALDEVEAAPQPAPMAQPAQLPGTAPEAPATVASAPLQAAAAPTAPQTATMPQLPGMLPGTALDAMPGANPFRTTDADRKALEEAEKRDTRLRIASGIMRGLGFVTQLGAGIAGNNALGNAAGAASVNFNPQIDGAEQVRRRIAERQANDYRAMQFDQSQRQAAMQAAAEQQQFALRERSVASTEALNAARREQISQENAQRELDAAAVRSDAAGARRAFRAYVETTDPRTTGGQNLRALIDSPEFEGMSADTVREQMRLYIANNRSFGLVSHGGGTRYVEELRDGQLVRIPVGGGSGGVARGGSPDRAARPVRAPGAPSAPAPAPTGETTAPATPAPAALRIGEEAIDDMIRNQLNARGIREGTQEWANAYQGLLSAYRAAPTAGARAAVMTNAANDILTRAEQEAGGRPAGVTDAMVDRLSREAAPRYNARVALDGMMGRINRWRREQPEAFRLAIATAGEIGEGAGQLATRQLAGQIRSDLQQYINSYMRETSGAAVTDSESRRIREAMGVGSWGFNPSVFTNFIARERSRYQQELETILRGTDRRAAAWWLDSQTQRRRRR